MSLKLVLLPVRRINLQYPCLRMKTSCVWSHSCIQMNSVAKIPCRRFQAFQVANKTPKLNCIMVLKRLASSQTPGEPTVKAQALLYATYGSFGLGGILLLAIVLRELKKKKLQWKGISQLNVPELKRLGVYRYKDVTLPQFVINQLENIEKFETTSDDIWVVSFPRSGTTWLQEIVYLIQTRVDLRSAKIALLDIRFPYLEFSTPGIKEVEKMKSPRLIKSHLPLSLLPKSVHENKPKIIYIARNPKDVVVSYYYFVRLLHPVTRYEGDFKEFFKLFLHDKVMYAPWWRHVEEFWERRNDDNILFLTYEDLKKDTDGTIERVAKFLGKTLTSKQKETIIDHCSFENMKRNPATNHGWFETLGVSDPKKGDFMRKGCVGDWANHLTDDMDQEINRMVTYKFQNSDLSFAYRGTHFESDTSETVKEDEKQ